MNEDIIKYFNLAKMRILGDYVLEILHLPAIPINAPVTFRIRPRSVVLKAGRYLDKIHPYFIGGHPV